MLTNSDIAELTALRHDLHQHPELAGQEVETAARVV
jgi:metal-dependent amidase/aminoacylase/carboxypeptidase family protein